MNIFNRNHLITALSIVIGLMISASTLSHGAISHEKKVEYDSYGKPLSSTKGEFVVNKSVNLRSRADTNSQVVGVLPAGATVMVDGATHGYYKITHDGKTGYSWHKFFTPISQ